MAGKRPTQTLELQLADTIQSRSTKLFRARTGCPQINASLVYKTKRDDGRWTLQANSKLVNDATELRTLQTTDTHAYMQIYNIRHLRSWTPLCISYELFQELLLTHNVFHPFLRSVLTFGTKLEENEYEFPSFRSRSSQVSGQSIEELTYVIRRVERHDRSKENPWSIRQTGVYHKVTYEEMSYPKSMFILLAPSHQIESGVSDTLSGEIPENDNTTPCFAVHQCLVTDSLRGWMGYMTWLEAVTKHDRNRIIVSNLDEHEVYFHADDRQTHKMYEDLLTDMQVILQTMANTITRIRTACQRHCQMSCKDGGSCSCRYMIQEFEEYAAETQQYLQRSQILLARVQSTVQLLADLLAYDEARALKQLARASQEESQNIMELTRRAAEDATAVKLLTIIGVLFLPLSTVTNFFSTQFVHLNDQDRVQISHDVWYLAALAVPLTAGTLFIWWLCLRLSRLGKVPWLERFFQVTREGEDAEQGILPFGPRKALTLPLFRRLTRQHSSKAE